MDDYINFGIAIQTPKAEAKGLVNVAAQALKRDMDNPAKQNAYAKALEDYAALAGDEKAKGLAAEWRQAARLTPRSAS